MDLDVVFLCRLQFRFTIMAIIATIGMPIVMTYTAIVYWAFRGKVKLGEFSYQASLYEPIAMAWVSKTANLYSR